MEKLFNLLNYRCFLLIFFFSHIFCLGIMEVLDQSKYPLKGFKYLLTISGIRVENPKYAFPIAFVWCLIGLNSLIVFTYSIINLMNNLNDLFVIIHHSSLFSTIMISVIWSYWKRVEWDKIVKDVHISFDYGSNLVKEKLLRMTELRKARLQRLLSVLIFFLSFNMTNMWFASFVEQKFNDNSYFLLFPLYSPYSLDSWEVYTCIIIWQHMVIGAALVTVYGILDVLLIFWDHLSNEINLLKFSIINVHKRADEMAKKYTKNNKIDVILYNRCLVVAMAQCGKHHSFICSYYLNAVKVVRFTYFVILIFGMTALVCAGVAIMFGSTFIKIKFTLLLIITFVYLYITFWFGNETIDMGDSIRWLVYDLDWVNMPKECQSTIKIMMVRTMKPLILTTSLGQTVDLENFMDLVKAAYTYFNMIYQSSQDALK